MRSGIRDFPQQGDLFLRYVQGKQIICEATIDHAPRPANLVTIVKAADDVPRCSECGGPVLDGHCKNCGVSF